MEQDFNYLPQKDVYFDTACQTLRPEPVIKSLTDYYYHHNSCGERVKYQWGITTDQKVAETRRLAIDFLKLKKKQIILPLLRSTLPMASTYFFLSSII